MERAHHTSTLWQVISDFGNPMVWGTFLFVLLMWIKGLSLSHILLSLAIFLLTVGVVSAITFNVARSRQFSDTRDLIEREIRSLPYFCTFLAYMVVAAIFNRQDWSPKWLVFLTSTMGIGLGICGFINLFWKVSFHTFASSAMATMFFMVTSSWWSLVLLLLVSLVIGWSRIRLGVHTPMQVLIGFLLGIFLPILCAMSYLGGF
ncbi:MAG TPA: phosphatase PAP2 family protein, partial [Coprothermobacter proteolyticus]|nr:phosphatase PAP2 family protein [Coprothermobacter proteolyticus]